MIEYLIKILLDGKEAEREVNRAGSAIGGLDATVMRVGKSILGMFALDRMKEAVFSTIEWADAINDAAKKVGITSERMQLFNLAAKQTGTDIGNITQSLKFLAQNMAESASKPTGEAAMAFKRLGVSLDQVKTMRPDELFLVMSERMRLLPDSVQKTADMISLLGRAAMDLAPAMQEGFAGAVTKAKELAAVVSSEDMEALEALKKKAATIGVQSQASLAKTLAKGAPIAGTALDIFSRSLAYNASGGGGKAPIENESALSSILLTETIGARARAYTAANSLPPPALFEPGSKGNEASAKAIDLQRQAVDEIKGLRADVKTRL